MTRSGLMIILDIAQKRMGGHLRAQRGNHLRVIDLFGQRPPPHLGQQRIVGYDIVYVFQLRIQFIPVIFQNVPGLPDDRFLIIAAVILQEEEKEKDDRQHQDQGKAQHEISPKCSV